MKKQTTPYVLKIQSGVLNKQESGEFKRLLVKYLAKTHVPLRTVRRASSSTLSNCRDTETECTCDHDDVQKHPTPKPSPTPTPLPPNT
jgi:hypothetical protein